MNSDRNKIVYGRMVAKAWTDEAFNKKLNGDPTQTARENGMELPPGATVSIVHEGEPFSVDTSGSHPVVRLLLTPRPADLTDEDILAYQGQPYACGNLA